MNILIRKLIFNEADIHLILWRDRPCFLVSELSNALDCVYKDDIPVFLRNGSNAIKSMHYDVLAGPDAKELKQNLEDSGIKKKFVQTMVVYFDGLRKYFNFRRTIEIKDFNEYLIKCKISLDEESEFQLNHMAADEVAPAALTTQTVQAPQPPVVTTAAAVVQKKVPKKKKNTTMPIQASDSSSYSEFLNHISLMEEFVQAFNKINISSEHSVAFTKDMVKYLHSHEIQLKDFLKQLKKWTN